MPRPYENIMNDKQYRRWPRWFKGDFHAHTFHSDGVLSPPDLLAHARAQGLDFFSITDHNIIDAYDKFGKHDDMLIIQGTEVTMDYGHFNVFGLSDKPNWMASLPNSMETYRAQAESGDSEYTPSELMRLTHEQGLLNSINHPILPPWAWLDEETDLRYVDFVEIWNDPTWPGNDIGTPAAIEMWSRWLNAGLRKTAIGGSDFHNPNPMPQKDGSIVAGNRLNEPTTHVYALGLSERSIMDGLLARHAWVTTGPTLAFGAQSDGRTLMIGEDAGLVDGLLRLQGTAEGTGLLVVQVVRNGEVVAEASGCERVGLMAEVSVNSAEAAWFRLDARDEHNRHRAVTNPIFTGPQPEPASHFYGDYLD